MNVLLQFWQQFAPVEPLVLQADAAPDSRSWRKRKEVFLPVVWFTADVQIAMQLRQLQFSICVDENRVVRVLAPTEDLPPHAQLLALHPRFLMPVLAGGQFIDVPLLFRQHALVPRGVIHVGAHEGQELDTYLEMGFKHIFFIEANPQTYERLQHHVGRRPEVRIAHCAICAHNGSVALRVTSAEASSSILPLKRHLDLYPEILEAAQVTVRARRLDDLLDEMGLPVEDYNFLHMDIQGAELLALQGAPRTLTGIAAISTEINYAELYEGCPPVEDLDDFLGPHGFVRRVTSTPTHPSWGDAFYVRGAAPIA
jgi:FkbM family methyltransferase